MLLHRETCRRCKQPGSKLVTPGMPMLGVKVQATPWTRLGPRSCVLQQLLEATWHCCNGCAKMAVSGMRTSAPWQLLEATWHC